MSIATDNTIGGHAFVKMSPFPDFVGETVARRSFPGRHGVLLRKTGRRLEPFTVETFADFTTIAAALNEYETYKTLIGAAAQSVFWAADDLSLRGFKFFVLDVRRIAAGRILLGVGGLRGLSAATLVCEWTLQAIKTSDTI